MKGIWALPWWNKRVHPPTVTIFMNLLKFGKSSSRHHAWSFIVRGGAFLAGTLSSFSISQTCDTQRRQKRQASPPGMFSTKWGVMRLRDMPPMICFSIFWAMYTIVTIIYGDINQYIPLFWALHEFVMVTMGDTTKKKLAKIGNIPRWRSPHDPTAVFDLWPIIFLRKTFEALVAAPLMLIPSPYF